MKLEANTRGAWMSVVTFKAEDAKAVRAAAHLLGHCGAQASDDRLTFRLVDDWEQVSEYWSVTGGWQIRRTA